MAKKLLVLVLISVSQLLVYVTADTQITYVNKGCDGTDFNYTKGSVYETNLDLIFTSLTSKTSSLRFYNYTSGVSPNKVYGLYQCRNDLSFDVCSQCVKDATRKIIEVCPLYGEANVWYLECMLRYGNFNIFSLSDTSYLASQFKRDNVSNYAEFAPILANTMNMLIKNASSSSSHFASAEAKLTLFEQLYTFAQCTPDIDAFSCTSCLKLAYNKMFLCCNASVYVMIFLPSCQLRYDTIKPILNDQSSSTPPLPPPPPPPRAKASEASNTTSMKPAIIGAIVACTFVGLLILSVILWICLCCKNSEESSTDVLLASSRDGPGSYEVVVKCEVEHLGDKEFEKYDFETLQNATQGFSSETKLGEGGFGIVYKGTLANGLQLAIKRLSKGTSGQGTKEFMTEAGVLAKLQHKNLVKLLGFCSEGEEKLLVYEFMSNASLDRFLFDAQNRLLLDWVTRLKIIMGIARGLQYLHEDSRLTIIHRDLKPGNILLDEEMNAKIADFGLAKLFGGPEKFGNTLRIVGTQGYMAPEYLMTGEYSDKSDVYSFGIMLLEIVSGQKNRTVRQSTQKEDLSIEAWRLWNEERSFEITDEAVIDNCSSNEVVRCIQIGLLCVQANGSQRPTMTEVVLMLTGYVDLPLPSPPMMSGISPIHSSLPIAYSGSQQSDTDLSSSKSVIAQSDESHDLYPRPR